MTDLFMSYTGRLELNYGVDFCLKTYKDISFFLVSSYKKDDKKVFTVNDEQMILDFFTICQYINQVMDRDIFQPFNYFDDLQQYEFKCAQKRQQIDTQKKMDLAMNYLSDSNYPFFKNINDKEYLIEMLKRFLERYGFWDTSHYIDGAAKTTELSEQIRETLGGSAFCAIGFTLIEMYNIYYYFIFPEQYIEKQEKRMEDDLYRKGFSQGGNPLATKIQIAPKYNTISKKWEIENTFYDLRDFIKYFLCAQLVKKQTKIKICEHCGGAFFTSIETSKYCSGVCRNRANVKKAYKKRKEQEEKGRGEHPED